jgi:hypothetical protein
MSMTETPEPAVLPDWDEMTDLDKGTTGGGPLAGQPWTTGVVIALHRETTPLEQAAESFLAGGAPVATSRRVHRPPPAQPAGRAYPLLQPTDLDWSTGDAGAPSQERLTHA